MDTVNNRIEDAVASLNESGDIAAKFIDPAQTDDVVGKSGNLKPLAAHGKDAADIVTQLGADTEVLKNAAAVEIGRIAHFQTVAFVAGTTYTDNKIDFVYSGVNYTPIEFPFTASADIQTDVNSGALTVRQGLTSKDISRKGAGLTEAQDTDLILTDLAACMAEDLDEKQIVKTKDNFASYQVVAPDTGAADGKTLFDMANGNQLRLMRSSVYQPYPLLADLRNAPYLGVLQDGDIVSTGGHTLPGVGGLVYTYDASDTSSVDNNATLIVIDGMRFKAKLDGFVTPEMFGAIPPLNTILQAVLDTGLNLAIGIGLYTMLDLRFTASGQRILAHSKNDSFIHIGSGVGIRNYLGADTGTSRFEDLEIAGVTFIGDYAPEDTDDWYLSPGTSKTLTQVNTALLFRIINNISVHDCRFINMHDGVQVHAGISSSFERNQFDHCQRGLALNNGKFYGDEDFKCTSMKVRDNYMESTYVAIWCKDLVDNALIQTNTMEFCNTGEYYFNCAGVTSRNYHESLYEGIRIDGGYTGKIFIENNSFFGGVPGNFWGNGAAIQIAQGTGSDAQVMVGDITGASDKPWIQFEAAPQYRGSTVIYNGFNGQEPRVQYFPEQASETGTSAEIETFYFNEADEFEIKGHITTVGGVAPTSGGYFHIVMDSATKRITEISNTEAGGVTNQKVKIYIGANYFQLTNYSSLPQTQKVKFRVKRTLTGSRF